MDRSLFEDLADALDRRQAVVADRELYAADPERHLAALKAASATVGRIEKALPPGTDPMLLHFLERQSYLKARDWLRDALVGDE